MPTLTTLRIGLPVCPVHSPERTRSQKSPIRSSVSWTSLTTSTPSTISERSRGIRSATWSTARSSETLMCSPANIASRRSSTPRSRASSPSRITVSSVIRFLEKSRWRPAPSATSRSPRSGSAAKRSRRCAVPDLGEVGLERLPRRPSRRDGAGATLTSHRRAHATFSRSVSIDSSRSSQDLAKAFLPSSWRRAASASTPIPALSNSGQHLLGVAAVGGHRLADLAVVGEGVQGRLGHRVDRERRGEALDVEDVGGLGVLGPGARPEQPLRAGALVHQPLHALASRAARGRRGRRGSRPRARAGCCSSAGASSLTATSQRLMKIEATEATSGSSPASIRRSIPRM